MNELKPCPFCGGEAEISHVNIGEGEWVYEVRCPYCGCGTDGNDSEEQAAAAWNTRVNSKEKGASL